MAWMFDQAPSVACITCRSVLAGAPVLVVTHYDDDHSWAFLDGETAEPEQALIVAMASVLELHPDVAEIASLAPGWTASRAAVGSRWSMQRHR